jgi:hypothetical protein
MERTNEGTKEQRNEGIKLALKEREPNDSRVALKLTYVASNAPMYVVL